MLAVHPEGILVTAEANATGNVLRAVVCEVLFGGAMTSLKLEAADLGSKPDYCVLRNFAERQLLYCYPAGAHYNPTDARFEIIRQAGNVPAMVSPYSKLTAERSLGSLVRRTKSERPTWRRNMARTAPTASDFGRGLAGFRARTAPELQPCGVAELDDILGGGFPRGSLVEVCGPSSSGRSSVGLALLAQATAHGEACAFIDVSDSLDPVSLAAAGSDISRLLWIRCGEEAHDSLPPLPFPNFAQSKKKKDDSRIQSYGFSWQHPRNQMHGIEACIPQLMRKKESKKRDEINLYESHTYAQETNLSVISKWKEEQIESDRQLPRRGENVRKQRHSPPRLLYSASRPWATRGRERKPWKRLEQALKAADLLLHSGGWGVVVFDLGSISWIDARRIPLSAWFRFQQCIFPPWSSKSVHWDCPAPCGLLHEIPG